MELHCLPIETPKPASLCSMDPQYSNCPPFAKQGREKERENRVVCPAVTRLPGPRSPQPAVAPAEFPTLVSGGRGAGSWPGHSYCSWRRGLGRQGWGAESDTAVNKQIGGECGGSWGVQDRHHLNQSPDSSQSEEHRSALSLYDNLSEAVGADSVLDMETSFQEDLQEQMNMAWSPERVQGLMEGNGASASYKITLAESCSGNQCQNPDQDRKCKQEQELDSGSCRLKQGDLTLLVKAPVPPPQQHLVSDSHQLPETEGSVVWPPATVQQPEQQPWSPRVPPPIPLADPSASALRSLLTSLQQQIVKQREEYETQIVR